MIRSDARLVERFFLAGRLSDTTVVGFVFSREGGKEGDKGEIVAVEGRHAITERVLCPGIKTVARRVFLVDKSPRGEILRHPSDTFLCAAATTTSSSCDWSLKSAPREIA